MTKQQRQEYYEYLVNKTEPLTDEEYDFIVNDNHKSSPFPSYRTIKGR